MNELDVREAIRDTIAQYTHAGDHGDLELLAAAFCEDGVLEVRGRGEMRGRNAIVSGLRGAIRADIVRHNIANIRFESVSADEVHVASYFTVFTEVGLDHYGRYRDNFVPVDDRWLIKHRFVSVDWRATDSRFPAPPSS